MSHPVFDAFTQSDGLGKLIFLSLWTLSIISWTLIVKRGWQAMNAKKLNLEFHRNFSPQKHRPLSVEFKDLSPNASVFGAIKRHTLQLLEKNRRFGAVNKNHDRAYLSRSDIDMISHQSYQAIETQVHHLARHLHLLSTIVTLAPFLGLLGTVWGILISFGGMKGGTSILSNELVFSGLSMALSTTVLGLFIAIPALVGYSLIKNYIKSIETDLIQFSNETLTTLELQYRKVDSGS